MHSAYFNKIRAMKNTIIDDIRAARAALAEENGYDRKKIYEWARKAHEARKQIRLQPESDQVVGGQPATRSESK